MNTDLSQDFQTPFTDDFLERAAELMAERTGKAKRALPLASHPLMSGILEKGKSPTEVKAILDALDRASDEPSLSPVPNSQSLMRGEVILTHLFGARAGEVCENFARETGLTTVQSREALGIAAAALAPQLAAKAKSYLVTPLSDSTRRASYLEVSGTQSMGKRIGQYAALLIATAAILLFAFGHSNRQVVAPLSNMSRTPALLNHAAQDPQTLGNLSHALAKNGGEALPQRYAFSALTFASGSATLSSEARSILKQVALELKAKPDGRIRLEGNADSLGNPIRNREIAQARAEVVRNELVRLGVSRKQVLLLGRGESSPVESNQTMIGRRHNRRVEIVLIGR